MVEKLKENWFVVLVGCVLTFTVCFYIYDTNKGKLPGKQVDGKDVVVSIGDTNYFSDDLYKELYGDEASANSAGTQVLFNYFEKTVVDMSMEVDNDMKFAIANAVTGTKQQYEGKEDQLSKQLQQAGYSGIDDLEAYYTHYFKLRKIISDAYDADIDNLFTPIYEKKNSRSVSHILVKISDFKNITKEEQKKMDDVDQALKDGKKFAEVAKEFSDDGSAADGGALGYVDNDTQFVKEFKEVALKLKKGETSDWVKSEYGYHKILVTETEKDALLADESLKDGIHSAIENANPKLNAQIIWQKGQDLGIEFANENIEKAIKEYLGIEE